MEDAKYFLGVLTRKDPKSKRQALKIALEEHAKGTAPCETLFFASQDAVAQLDQNVMDSESIRLILEETAFRE
ncbi:hypothetical protein N7532_007574 [Penicillium argentinense]|uniref:Uncharacterized protein n=1 Tax=Penicillium argentinense TaxID=1131581 RepID=A0A9W9F7Z2_9EURO|nr:uncharacterized protein N7532_007574 [Penicillium argentinense]KAJ5095283.1 hypothetical protein N7532_007574 [Penicillium argentinense]